MRLSLISSLLLVGLCLGASESACCHECGEGKQKYYSVPKQGGGQQCGEACLEPSRYPEWKLFEPALLPGSCASQGFTQYTETATDGVCPLCVTNDRYTKPAGARAHADAQSQASEVQPAAGAGGSATGAVVGGVVGSCAVVAIAFAAVRSSRSRRQDKQAADARAELQLALDHTGSGANHQYSEL
eukprot:g4968.t1